MSVVENLRVVEATGGRTHPATNKSIRLPHALVAKVERGRIARLDAHSDMMGMAAQLGLASSAWPKKT